MRNRTPLLGLLVAVLLAVGFYFLLWSPGNDALALVHEETAQLETRRSTLRNEVAFLREVERNQDEIRAELARLETYIPTGIAQPEVVRQLQTVADEADTEILSMAFAPPAVVEGAPATGTPETSLARIPVTMTIEGGYFKVADFFRRLEVEVPRAVFVGDLTVEKSEEGWPDIKATWIGDLFAVVPTTAIPPPAPPEPEAAEGAEGSETQTPDEGAAAATAEDVT